MFHYGTDFGGRLRLVIALVGDAGNFACCYHLQYAVHIDGQPIDPEPFPWPHRVCRWVEFHSLCPIPMRARGTGRLSEHLRLGSRTKAPTAACRGRPARDPTDGSGPASSSP